MRNKINAQRNSGFTLIEVLIASTLFIIIGTATYFAFENVLQAISKSQVRSDAISLIKGEIETVRNMPYADVGISGGYPVGKLLASKNVTFSGNAFNVKTYVRNIDDPYDGLAGGTPNDTAPADYKLVQYDIACTTCGPFTPISMTTTVSAKGLESASMNGSLFIKVLDANGAPVPNASVHVVNTKLVPTITIDDATNNDGMLQLVDIPPSINGYQVTVTKAGYSTAQTYDSLPSNPNPNPRHITVSTQQVSPLTLFIDKISTLNITAQDNQCKSLSALGFSLTGANLIGQVPDILKYPTTNFTTDGAGKKAISNLEWDTYAFASTGVFELAGFVPAVPFVLNPGMTVDAVLLFEPKVAKSLAVTVVDDVGVPVDQASVRLVKGAYDTTLYTARRTIAQTDWGSSATYDSQSGGVNYDSPTTELNVQSPGGGATSTEWIISNTFDMGTSSVTLYRLWFTMQLQPAHSSPDAMRIQIAANNDNTTWDFVGPDGTAGTYFTTNDVVLPAVLNGKRYLRYKLYFYLDGVTTTLSFKDIAVDFNSTCVPTGQILFNSLGSGTYTITINKVGFQTYTDAAVSVSSDWQQYKATLAK